MSRELKGATKLQSPLYCAAWVKQYCFVAGGGGKKSSGIPNRVWCLDHSGGHLGHSAASYDTGEDAPLRMAIPPDHSCILLAVGSGGLIRVDLDLSPKYPVLKEYSGEDVQTLKGLGEIKCLNFSRNGRILAVGCEDSSLHILDWPSLVTRKHIRGDTVPPKDALRDLDFSNAHGNKVLGATYEDGSCILWEWASGVQLTALHLPTELRRGSINRIRFLQDGTPRFFTVVNAAGQGHILLWQQDKQGEIVLQRQLKAHNSAITAFDVSRSGKYLGTGTSEGEVAIFSAAPMAPVKVVCKGHMVFATAVAFSSEDRGLLSVSADASARTVLLNPRGSTVSPIYLSALVAILIAVLVGILARTSHQFGWASSLPFLP